MTEGPYKLPEGWRWVRLGEVFVLRNGKFIRKSELQESGTIRVYGSNGLIGYTTGTRVMIDRDTIVIGRVGACGAINWAMAPAWVSDNAMYVARWLVSCEPHYMVLALKQANLGAFSKQGAQPSISQEEVYSALIPLPPLDEQRRIVARLEELMARVREAKRLRQQAKEDAERLMQAALAETFPRPGTEPPPGWRWVRLGEVFDLQQGASMSPKRRVGRNLRPFLRTKNILWGSVDVSSVDEMDFTEEEVEKLCLQPGDLLVCEGGDVGRTAIWEGQLPLALYQNHIHRLRRKNDDTEPRFFMYWMRAAYQVFRAYEGAESRTAIPNLSGRRLKTFLAPLPPLEEQRRIVAHLEAVQEKVRALKEAQAATEAELQRLEQAILDKAFRGEL